MSPISTSRRGPAVLLSGAWVSLLSALVLFAGQATAESATALTGPIHVGGDVQAPVKVYAPAPSYSEDARKARIQGVVILQVIIDQKGEVTQTKILKDLAMGLGEQAKETISTWRFEPATLNDQPVEVYYNLTVNFRLGDDQPPLHVGGDVEKPVKIHAPRPSYSDEALKAHIQGVVIMQAVIDKNGNVAQTKVLKGLPMGLSEKAVEAVSGWRFEPATQHGEPVEVYYNLTVNFRLDQSPPES